MHLGNPQNYIKEDHLEWSLKTACIRKYCQHQGFQHQGFLNKMFSNSRESYLFAYMKLVTSQIGNSIVICLYNYHVKKKEISTMAHWQPVKWSEILDRLRWEPIYLSSLFKIGISNKIFLLVLITENLKKI